MSYQWERRAVIELREENNRLNAVIVGIQDVSNESNMSSF